MLRLSATPVGLEPTTQYQLTREPRHLPCHKKKESLAQFLSVTPVGLEPTTQ